MNSNWICSNWKEMEELLLFCENKLYENAKQQAKKKNIEIPKPILRDYISEKTLRLILEELFLCRSSSFFLSLFVKDSKVRLEYLKGFLDNFFPICPNYVNSKRKISFDDVRFFLQSFFF